MHQRPASRAVVQVPAPRRHDGRKRMTVDRTDERRGPGSATYLAGQLPTLIKDVPMAQRRRRMTGHEAVISIGVLRSGGRTEWSSPSAARGSPPSGCTIARIVTVAELAGAMTSAPSWTRTRVRAVFLADQGYRAGYRSWFSLAGSVGPPASTMPDRRPRRAIRGIEAGASRDGDVERRPSEAGDRGDRRRRAGRPDRAGAAGRDGGRPDPRGAGDPALLEAVPARKVPLEPDMTVALRQVREALATRRPVLVSGGDPLFYGVARYLCDRLGKDQFEVVPHVSSMQLAFARVKESWEDAYLTSLAGRPLEAVDRPDPDGREGRPVLQRRVPAAAAGAGAARPRDRLLPGLRLREPRLARRAGHAGRAGRPGRRWSSTRSTS